MKFQTSASKFKIGDVTIFTLDDAPNNNLGVQGDVFIRTDDPSMFVKQADNTWDLVQNVSTPDFGFTGSQGASSTIVDTLNNVSELPATPINEGDLYFIDSSIYFFDGTIWKSSTDLRGFVGSTGFTGSKGDIGFTGSTGLDGEDGTSVTILGTQASTNDLPASGNTAGDGYLINGDLYVWDGSTWNNVGQIQGPRGYTGSRGFTGSRGDTGFVGSRGSTGFTGSIGFTGSRGFTGSKGDTGFTGSFGFTGSIGFTGSKGDTGFTGSQGEGAQVTLFNVNNNFFTTPSTSTSIVYTSPSTSGLFQIFESIYATNISSSEQSFTCYISYNGDNTVVNDIPIPVGSSIEVIKRPKVLPPNTNIRMAASSSSAVNVVGSYRSNNNGDFIGGGNNFTSSNFTDVYTVSNSLGVELSSLLLASDTSLDTTVTVVVTNSVNSIRYYLSNNIVVPANGSIELLSNPKFMEDTWKIRVSTSNDISVIYSGINIT